MKKIITFAVTALIAIISTSALPQNSNLSYKTVPDDPINARIYR